MKLLLVAFALVAAVAAYEPIELDYHNAYGIPEAERIKKAESALDFDGSRITGGSVSSLGAHPFLGGLVITLTTGANSVCGSSLITNTRAVTAAHCWRTGTSQGRQAVVVMGSTTLFTGGTRITSTNVQMHANYNMNNLNNDVAIIVLSWVNFNNIINRINLATGSNQFVGTWAVAAGYGRTATNTPIPNNQVQRHVSLQVITNAACQSVYGSSNVVSSTLCVATPGGRSTCSGDSGGPLAVGNTLIGITSFVSRSGCQQALPAGFARVTSFASWIQARL